MRDDRFQAVVPAGRPARAGPQPAERELCFVDHDQHVGDFHLEVPGELADGLTAEVHERQRLGQQRAAFGPTPFGDHRLGWRRFESDRGPPRDFVDDREPDIVARPLVLSSGIAEPDYQFDGQLHGIGYFFFSSFGFLSSFFSAVASSPSSFLPFLMTSGSAGVAVAAAAASAGAATSSAFGMITCTSIASPSVTGFHFGLVAMSRTRIPWCSISSLTSMSTCSGMSAGRHSMTISRRMNSSTPPCCLTPFGSPCTVTGMVTSSSRSMAIR